jgi:hypothetical protein
MSNSSQQQTSLDDLLKDITIDLSESSTTIVGSMSDYSYSSDSTTMSTITLSPSTYSIGTMSPSISTISIDNSSFTFNLPQEWVDSFPAWSRVNDMCKKYPGLEIAFRNFQTVYQLVKDDYDNPVPKK